MKPSQKHMGISPKNSALVTFSSLATNAALRGAGTQYKNYCKAP
ncbi:hypothetical protein D047_5012 [Vibrio parahaemolyticus VPTS-2010_2]|nr:hypothetical protein D047_5012 [Vibrio parahaemolyticus VPTS-2010_2]